MASLYRRGRVAWIKYQQHGRVIRASLRTTDPTVARYLLRKKEAELAEGRSPLPPQRVELLPCVEEFLRDTALHKKPSTLRKDRLHLMDFSRWARTPANRLTESLISDYLKHLIQERALSPFTANGALGILQKWLTWCQRHQPPYVVENPAARIRGFSREHNPARFLTAEEIERLLEAATPSHLYGMVATALFAGLRVGELLHLEWSDIDFDRNTIMVKNKHEWQFKTKSRKFRVIPLNDRLRDILAPRSRPSGFCFLTPDGKPYRQQPRRMLSKITRQAGLTGVGWHTLRRTFGSQLAMKSVSLYKIQVWLGHSDPRITVQYYAHLSPEFDADINKIGQRAQSQAQ